MNIHRGDRFSRDQAEHLFRRIEHLERAMRAAGVRIPEVQTPDEDVIISRIRAHTPDELFDGLPPPGYGSLEEEFRALCCQLRRDTWFDSTSRLMRDHPSRRRIVRMGEAAVPLIMRSIQEQQPLHWFQTLREITGHDPTTPQMAGKIRLMNETWLRWGREHGYCGTE